MPVATLLASAGSSHRLTAPRYGLTSYCGRSLFTSDARKDAATQSLFPRMTDLRLPPREKVKVFLRVLDVLEVLDVLDFLRSLSSGSAAA